jgi:hypothetical protein
VAPLTLVNACVGFIAFAALFVLLLPAGDGTTFYTCSQGDGPPPERISDEHF